MRLLLSATSAARNVCWRCQHLRPTTPSSSSLRPSVLSLKSPPRSLRHYAASPASASTTDLAHTRNIGIIAHIDAGKTTTSERMLFYSGFTRRIGEVDEGSTVMDYLPAERARGITIMSAAITFNWTPPAAPPHIINLIDTPGHADFTFEVERSIRVLDGAVTILDGVAGVEAQTEKVWRQAAKYGIPRIIFINKLDRVGARFGDTVREVAAKLNGWPAVLQLPFYENDGKGSEDVLRGVVDLVEKRVFLYEHGGDGQKIDVHGFDWLAKENPTLHTEAIAAQEALIELLTEHDSDLVELYLEIGNAALIPPAAIKTSLRKLTLSGTGAIIPLLCGASFRNIGVQPLLDAVIDYLPSPLDRPPTAITHSVNQRSVLDPATSRTCALAFKVVNDPKRGAMVFVRVYSGTLTRAMTLYNTGLGVKERAHRLLQMYADEAVDIDSIPAGHIGVIIGLKQARTGDTLISEHGSVSAPKTKKSKTALVAYDPKTLQLRPIDVPPPVFFASLEPYSISDTKPLQEALAMLLREDPSLSVTTDADSGQTLLSGMGELHLEIGRDRLVQDLKARADMGKILIAYRETISVPFGPVRSVIDREIAAKPAKAACTATLTPLDARDPFSPDELTDGTVAMDGNTVSVSIAHEYTDSTGETSKAKLPAHLTEAEIVAALMSGATAALSRGPHLSLPLRDVAVALELQPATDLFGTDSTPAAISSAARAAIADALAGAQASAPGQLVEPVMSVSVSCSEADLGKVVADLSSSRGGHVLSLGDSEIQGDTEIEMARVYIPRIGGGGSGGGGREAGEGRKRVVNARVPLGEMVGYLKFLRAMTRGEGAFVMTLEGWERMQGPRAKGVEKEMRGE